jgi:glycine oxidase
MKVDCLIVGSGLAGLCFAETLFQNGCSFAVISDDSQSASEVAGGLYNPLILKRFTLAFQAVSQLDYALPFYAKIEKRLEQQFDYKQEVVRILHEPAEQNRWFEARDGLGYERFMDASLLHNTTPQIKAPHKLARVFETGRLDTAAFRAAYSQWLAVQGLLIQERFEYDRLETTADLLRYGDIEASHIVFAEGFGLNQNPFFNHLPLQGSKGELLTIYAPELEEKRVVKSSVFIIPLGNHRYRVGATYDNHHLNQETTDKAKNYLLQQLKKFLDTPYTVVDHVAGVRPSVSDRRPLLGQHEEHKRLWVLNGFGSRGVMIAPYASKHLYEAMYEGQALPEELDIKRFELREQRRQARKR